MGTFKDEGNILVSNQSRNVLVNYNFMLRVEGIYDLPCKSVHSFTKENEFEYVQEGGLNDYVHMLRKPVSKPFSFTVERYVGMDIIPPLQLGAELVLPVVLMVAPGANKFGNAKRTFVFTGCTVMSKTYGELNAEKSDLLTETIVIGYREMTEVTIPVHEGDAGKLWKFDGKDVEGNGELSANSKGTETGSPQTRRWLVKEGQEGESEESARTRGIQSKPAEVRRWLVKKGQEGKSEESARTYEDIYPKEKETAEAQKENGESSITGVGESKPRVRTGPDTGEAEVRRWLIKEGQEGKSEESARTYEDIYPKEKETAEAQKENGESSISGVEESKPRVRTGPDTGEAEVRRWLIPEGQEGESEESARTRGIQSKPAEVRRWLVKKGQEGKSEESARTYADFMDEETPETGKSLKRKWKPDESARPEVDTGAAEKRKWKPDESARTYADFMDKETSEAGKSLKRKWKPDESARPEVNSKEAKKRKWKPDESAKPEVKNKEAKKRKWPPTESAKKS